MIRRYKRKLILSKAQEQRLTSWIGACRVVYNMALEIRIAAYRNKQQSVHKYALMKQLTDIKHIDWIADVCADSLQLVIERLDFAYKNFFRTFRAGGGYPKFANKRKYKSIGFKQVSIKNHIITLPKIGRLRLVKDAAISGVPKTAIVVKEPTGFFVVIQCKDVPKKFDSENQAIGLDMGLCHFCINSDGGFIANPKHFENYERKLRIANRSLSRKKRGSNRWKKQVKLVSLINHKIGNARKDFLHKESTKIAKKYSVVYVEDLKIANMAKNKHVSKQIMDCGWGIFRRMLEYKTNVIAVSPKNTSQICFECGAIDAKSRLNQSEFCCMSCGHVSNADVNAAKNILRKGIALDRQREALVCA